MYYHGLALQLSQFLYVYTDCVGVCLKVYGACIFDGIVLLNPSKGIVVLHFHSVRFVVNAYVNISLLDLNFRIVRGSVR